MRLRSLLVRLLTICLVLALVSTTAAQRQEPPQPVKWSLALEPATGAIAPGGPLTAVVTATIEDGWHVYSTDETADGPRPLQIGVAKGDVFADGGKLDAPEPEREMDSAFGQVTSYYAGSAVFRLPVTIAAATKPGEQKLTIEVKFQTCDGRMCLPMRVVPLQATVTIAGK